MTTAGIAAASPKVVASSASAMPGATTARLVVCSFEIPMKLFMMPHTVPNRPTNGAVAPMLTWTIWLAKTLELIGARRSLARAHANLAAARSLAEAAQPASDASPQVARLIQAVDGELRRSPDRRDIDGIKERIAARFERIEASVGRQMLRGTGLATTDAKRRPIITALTMMSAAMNMPHGVRSRGSSPGATSGGAAASP
jgi:biopolymer transport protein ExbB